MKHLLIGILSSAVLLANNFEMLQPSKQESLAYKKQSILLNSTKSRLGLISPLVFTASQTLSKGASSDTKSNLSSVGVSLSQAVFQSGGIYFSLKYTNKNQALLLKNLELETALEYSKLFTRVLQLQVNALQIQQNGYSLANKEIEVELNKAKYLAGDVDIVIINNSIMDKNRELKNRLILQQTAKQNRLELKKITHIPLESITLPRFKTVSLKTYVEKNLAVQATVLNSDALTSGYWVTISSYLPTVTLSGSYGYQDYQSDKSLLDYNGNNYSVGIAASIPLSAGSFVAIQEAKVKQLQAKADTTTKKIEEKVVFEQIMSTIDYYKSRQAIAQNNIALYDELLSVIEGEVKAGYKTQYDLDIMQNSKAAEVLEIEINEKNIQIELAKLYFAMQIRP